VYTYELYLLYRKGTDVDCIDYMRYLAYLVSQAQNDLRIERQVNIVV